MKNVILVILLLIGFSMKGLRAADNATIAAIVGNDVITIRDVESRVHIAAPHNCGV